MIGLLTGLAHAGQAIIFVGATVHGRAGDNSMGASESTALDVGKDAVFIPWKDGQSSAVAPQPTKKPQPTQEEQESR